MIIEKKFKVEKIVPQKKSTNPAMEHCFVRDKHIYATSGRAALKAPITTEIGDVDGFVTVDAIKHGRKKGEKGRAAVLLFQNFCQARTAKFDRPSEKELVYPSVWTIIEQASSQGNKVAEITIDAGDLHRLAQALGDEKITLVVRKNSLVVEVQPAEKIGSVGLLALLDKEIHK